MEKYNDATLSAMQEARDIADGKRITKSYTSANALCKVQNAMEGVAERLGVYDENDVQKLVDEVRYENAVSA